MRPQEYDVVKLKSGEEGTIVHIFKVPDTAYLIESKEEDGKLLTIKEEDIDSIIWKAN